MNKQRQRKLEARARRQESLANSGIASQEPKMYPGKQVSEKKLNKVYVKIGLKGVQDDSTDVADEVKTARNKKRNLAGIKKITVKGKEK